MDYLEQKNINDFNEKIVNVFNLLTLAGEYRIIGSASLKKIKYSSDYDLDELFEKKKDSKNLLHHIYMLFLEKFKEAKQDENKFITDFKCGMDTNGEPLRWDFNDMKKGYKILDDGRKMTFDECLLIKATIKMDMIVLIDGVFTEFSENYYLKLGNDGNFFPHDISKEHILNQLLYSYDEYMNVDENYLKGLKRIFAYKLLENEKHNYKDLKKMIIFFNSNIGIGNKARADLDILLLILEQQFRKPKMDDIKNNLKIIENNIQPLNLKMLNNALIKTCKIQQKTALIKSIENIRNKIYNIVNKKTLDYIIKNKNLLLY